MKETVHSRIESIEEQFRGSSNEELFEQLLIENQNLAKFGVWQSISIAAYGASAYGDLYEDRKYPQGGARITPMNFFMALLNSQPDLLKLPIDKFQELGGAVSRIAMATDLLVQRMGRFEWPEHLKESPQEQLHPKKP